MQNNTMLKKNEIQSVHTHCNRQWLRVSRVYFQAQQLEAVIITSMCSNTQTETQTRKSAPEPNQSSGSYQCPTQST